MPKGKGTYGSKGRSAKSGNSSMPPRGMPMKVMKGTTKVMQNPAMKKMMNRKMV